jgi:NADPH:quinone reductase-like Zn-dependent oxidoreductase
VITRHGGPEVLRVEERPEPLPGSGEGVVDVRAAGVNVADALTRVGLYPDAPRLPAVVGYEVAGVIAHGTERVIAPTRFGGYAERVAVREAELLPLPSHLSFVQGAAIVVAYSTAWTALVRCANLQPGERVLVHAAAGSVGLAAVQLGKLLDAYFIGTCSSWKHDAVLAHGADEVYDYGHIGCAAVDVVMDGVGGLMTRDSYRRLRAGGRLVTYGASALLTGDRRRLLRVAPHAASMIRGFNGVRLIGDSRSVIGLNMLRLADQSGSLKPYLDPLRGWLADGTLRPIIAAEFVCDRAAEAHRLLGERANVGKVVLVP